MKDWFCGYFYPSFRAQECVRSIDPVGVGDLASGGAIAKQLVYVIHPRPDVFFNIRLVFQDVTYQCCAFGPFLVGERCEVLPFERVAAFGHRLFQHDQLFPFAGVGRCDHSIGDVAHLSVQRKRRVRCRVHGLKSCSRFVGSEGRRVVGDFLPRALDFAKQTADFVERGLVVLQVCKQQTIAHVIVESIEFFRQVPA